MARHMMHDESWEALVLGAIDCGKTGLINLWSASQPMSASGKRDYSSVTSQRRVQVIDKKRCSVTMTEAPRLRRTLRTGQAVGWVSAGYFARQMKGPSIFFIVYSTADRVSFDEVVSFWLWVVARTLSYLPNVALIGIHSDRSRQVSKADGAKLAKQCGIPFFEVDSRTGKPDDMEKAVASAVRIGRKWRLFFYGQSEEQWPAPFRVNHRMHEYYPTREDFVIWERSREMSRPLPLPHELDKARLSISGALPPSPTDSGFSGESSVFDSMPSSPSSTFSKDSGFSEGSFWDKQSVIPSAASVKSKALCIIM